MLASPARAVRTLPGRAASAFMLVAATLAALSLLLVASSSDGRGQAFASVDVLPNAPQGIPSTVADIVKGNPSWGVTVRGVAAEVTVAAAGAAGATVAVPAGAVIGAVIGTGAALHIGWTLGNELGQALPCWSCSAPTPNTDFTYSNGFRITGRQHVIGTATVVGRVAANVVIPSGFCGSGCTAQLTLYYSDTSAGTSANGFYYTLNSNTVYSGATAVLARDACTSSCGFGETRYASGGCAHVYDNSSGATFLRIPWGIPPAGSCSALVKSSSGTAQSTAPTAESGGNSGAANPSTPLKLSSTSTCRPAAGGAEYNLQGDSKVFTYDPTSGISTVDGSPDTIAPVIPVPACNGLDTRTRLKVVAGPADGSSPKPVIETTPFPSSPPSGHPEWAPCMVGGTQFPCALTLQRLLPDGTTRPYDPATDYRAAPGEQPSADPESWLCRWGTLRLPVAECSGIYQQPPRLSPVPPPASGENCMSGAVSWNPINWVFVPVKCALTWALPWAFVPAPGVVDAAVLDVKSAWAGTAPAVGIGMLTDFFEPWLSLPDGGSCSGPLVSIHVPTYGEISGRPFSTCSDLISWLLDLVLPIETVLCGLAAVVAGSRVLARTIEVESPL